MPPNCSTIKGAFAFLLVFSGSCAFHQTCLLNLCFALFCSSLFSLYNFLFALSVSQESQLVTWGAGLKPRRRAGETSVKHRTCLCAAHVADKHWQGCSFTQPLGCRAQTLHLCPLLCWYPQGWQVLNQQMATGRPCLILGHWSSVDYEQKELWRYSESHTCPSQGRFHTQPGLVVCRELRFCFKVVGFIFPKQIKLSLRKCKVDERYFLFQERFPKGEKLQ